MIRIDNITVKYHSGDSEIAALSSFSLNVTPGEYLAVLGSNGSGKSTLLKALLGLIPLASGEISVLGQDISYGSFAEKLFGRVGAVFQEPDGQFLMPSVRREIASVLQNLGLPRAEQENRFREIIGQLDLAEILNQKPEDLSGGQKQLVNLACALVVQPQILLLDEPTTFLDPSCRQFFIDRLERLHREGMTIFHITQYPGEAMPCGRVCVLDRGHAVFDGSPDELFADEPLLTKCRLSIPTELKFRKVFGFSLNDDVSRKQFISDLSDNFVNSQPSLDNTSISPVIEAANIEFRYAKNSFVLKADKLKLYNNQVAGLLGPVGSGKSTLALLLAGLYDPQAGEIKYDGLPYSRHDHRDLHRNIGILWQLPELTLIGPRVIDELELIADNFKIAGPQIDACLSKVGLDGSQHRIVDTLSGGEKRKLSLAGLLIAEPEYMILDEPGAFLDPQSQADLIAIIRQLKHDGRGIFVISHDMSFLAEIADLIIGIRDGAIQFDLNARDFFSDTGYAQSLGMIPEPMMMFREELRERGIGLPDSTLNPVRLKAQLNGS